MAKSAVMNDTKWDELRLGMCQLGDLSPSWRTLDIESGYLSDWDGEWYHHFRNGGYSAIEWVELRISTETQRRAVLAVLQSVHVPGFETDEGYKVVGYVDSGQPLDYL